MGRSRELLRFPIQPSGPMRLTPTDVDPNRLTLLAVKIGGVVFAALVGLSIGGGVFQNAALIVIGIIAFLLWFYSYQGFLLLCVSSLFVSGSNPSIPSGLRIFELLAMLAVARLGLEQVVLRRRKLERGPTIDWLLILCFMSVVFWHAATNRMGMKIFGADVWGGRQYIGIFLGFILYMGFQTVQIDAARWRWLPLATLIPACIDASLALLGNYAPDIENIISGIYDIGGGADDVGLASIDPNMMGARVGMLGTAGALIVLAVLAYRKTHTLFVPRPSTFAMFGGMIFVLAGSFRSTVLSVGLMGVAASIRDLRMRAIFPLGAVIAAVMFLTVAHGRIIHLPEQAQRALVFLPGNWDPQVTVSASSSNDFRWETWSKWREKYFPRAPWIGRGFGFDSRELAVWQFELSAQAIKETLLVGQELHNGFLSSIDCIGIVGTTFLIAWVLRTLWRIGCYLLDPSRHRDEPALRWLAFYLTSWTLLYWVGALKLSGFLPAQFVLTSLFVRLLKETSVQEDTQLPILRPVSGRRRLHSPASVRVISGVRKTAGRHDGMRRVQRPNLPE
ncbi:hypothetical protein ACXR0O_10565 [Verrucomicrobiota bacterium sgz303538]